MIEEVDEQQTITSIAGRPAEQKPSVRTIFTQPSGPPPPSAPLPVPGRTSSAHISKSAPTSCTSAVPPMTQLSPTRSNVTYTEVLSVKSAPGFNDNSSGLGSGSLGAGDAGADTISIGSNTDSSEDEFTKLKQSRLRERQERIKYARSVSAQQNLGDEPEETAGENEFLLMEMTGNSRTGLLPKSTRSSMYSEKGDS